MYLVIITIYLLIDNALFSYGYPKCCKTNEHLKEIENQYMCTKTADKRVQILANETDFLERQIDGKCFDLHDTQVWVFKVKGGQPIRAQKLDEPFFPKCCPLNYTYNSMKHSCEENQNVNHGYIKNTIITIGLPNCNIIRDTHLNEGMDLYPNVTDVTWHSRHCVDRNENASFSMRECQETNEVCKDIRCVKKCCPDGQSFVNHRNCVDTYTHGLDLKLSPNIQSPKDPFAVITNITCKRIFLMSEDRYNFNLTRRGDFRYYTSYNDTYISEDISKNDSYCLEHFHSEKANGFYVFKCRDDIPLQKRFIYPLVPKILSCVFLVVTIFIYFILEETRTVFGKILMNYCTSMLFLFSFLCYTHRNLGPGDKTCKFLAYSLIYLSTASFTWLNVLCCDIWRTFGSSTQIRQRRRELKKLVCYLLYGWGMPLSLTLIIFFLAEETVLPSTIQPFVGSFNCFIEDRPNNYGAIIFLRLPHFLFQLVNIVLFVKTIVYCLRVKNDIHEINDTTKSDKAGYAMSKERLSLVFKLAIIMGATFIFDVLSGFVKMSELGVIPEYIEVIWDCINCSQGIFIFIIFICKKRIYRDILRTIKLTAKGGTASNSLGSASTTTSTLKRSTRNS